MPQEKLIDLHLHSEYSDGELKPAQLVKIAADRNLAAVALADHDCVDGVGEFENAAASAGLESISGVELSCIHRDRDLHILGYGVNPQDEKLREMLRLFCETRERRGIEIVEKLDKLGVHIDKEWVLREAGDGALGRPHIAKALIKAGYAKDPSEAFEKYLGEKCPAYVEKYKMDPKTAVRHIHDAGGLAFVAHPGFYLDDVEGFDELLEEEFDGIEVYHPKHDAGTAARLIEIVNERELLMSGGSDFHGFAGRDNIGEPDVPYEYFTRIKERLDGRSS
jgi:predicted metal-dependent phosphoesterase TrpH